MKKALAFVCLTAILITTMIPMYLSASEILKTDKTIYTEGEPILITAEGNGDDWVGIYRKGEAVDPSSAGGVTSIRWYYVAKEGNSSGSEKNIFDSEYINRQDLASIPAGEYTIFLLANGGYTVISKVDITVEKKAGSDKLPKAPSDVAYQRSVSSFGLADGKLIITADETAPLPDGYRAYWGNENGPLADYTAFAPIKCTGKVTEYEMVSSTLIPKDADRIVVYALKNNVLSKESAFVTLPEGCCDYDFGSLLYEMQVLSDIHLNSSQNHLHNRHFAMALEDIKNLSPNSIGIFINGDIADHGEESEYRSFRELIANAGPGIPNVYCAIGNHDLADGPYQKRLRTFLKYTEPGVDSVYYDMWINDLHFIFLGSEEYGLNAELSDSQLTWFEEKLDENRDENRPTYVFLHQGLIDTVAGTFAYQKWHGINQSKKFANILKKHPEVVLFSGHSHWEMDSPHSMKERDDRLPTIFNTAAGAYLWNDAAMATNVGIEGSQGYYIYAYEDMILVRGRDFVTNQWIASAQFAVRYPKNGLGSNGANDAENNILQKDNKTSQIFPLMIGAAISFLAVASAAVGIFFGARIAKRRKAKHL